MRISKEASDLVLRVIKEKQIKKMISWIQKYEEFIFFHSVNVAYGAVQIGIESGLDKEHLEVLCKGALLHDIGKTRIPLDILKKENRLTDKEFEMIKKHPGIGKSILEANRFPDEVAQIAYLHHLKKNGNGYPPEVSPKALSQMVMIVTVCDIYDALTDERCYKTKLSQAEAVQILINEMNKGELDRDIVILLAENIMNSIKDPSERVYIENLVRREKAC